MKVNFEGELRNVTKGNQFTRKNGTVDFNYSLLLEDGERSYIFNTNAEIFQRFSDGYIEKGNKCVFTADYNPQFKSNQFVIISCSAI